MARNYIRFQRNGEANWGLLADGFIWPLAARDLSTKDFLEFHKSESAASRMSPESEAGKFPAGDAQTLSPITAPCQIICQGANYRQHVIESGMNPDDKTYNLFFTKSDASLTGPVGNVVTPSHVKLLDYEIELGLVFGKSVHEPVDVDSANLSQYVSALFMANDISARDIQIPQLQWYKGKSYRTFLPAGPVLCVLDPEDYELLGSLELTLSVNGQVRQKDSTANLVFKPAESISELSRFCSINAGDVLLTGTPSGCALRAPGKLIQKMAGLLSEKKKWQLFAKGQTRRTEYLKPGDAIHSSIRTRDGRIDLGEQHLRVQ